MKIKYTSVNEINGLEGPVVKELATGHDLWTWALNEQKNNRNIMTNEYWIEDIKILSHGSFTDINPNISTGDTFETPLEILREFNVLYAGE